ncbi:hypothetical protein DU505_10005 [Billgrantia montanilacus]|uniref:Glycosyl transferase family 28 C-terminal domain-containing protein n=2 Tax=Billgrantia montanilacus TaxID=2282305 RepID=A0A368TZY0_9GAMM|nr:hypothetical protein DU505_10005 [Halomonas montanilacus]
MHSYPKLQCVWVKRGLYKDSVDQGHLKSLASGFSLVLAPGELVAENEGPTTLKLAIHQLGPISLLDRNDLMNRALARDILRLPKDQPCAYVQLGAGNINGIDDVQDKIISNLREKGIRVVLGQSPIALHTKPDLRADSVIVDYPNSKYFRAFDFAVLAGGYNSVCEAVRLGLPALFIPNTETGADDQLKRVQQSLHYGPYEMMVEYSKEEFDSVVKRLLECQSRGCDLPATNGAVLAAELIGQHGV